MVGGEARSCRGLQCSQNHRGRYSFHCEEEIHPSFSGLLRACELLVEESNPARGGGGGRGAGLGGKHTEYSGSSNEPARGESRGQPETVFLHFHKHGRVCNFYTDSLKCHFHPTLLSSLFTGE